jgi:hypothetical protein
MAFVNTPTATLSFTFRDASGSMATMQINVPYATLAAAAITAAAAIRTAMLALSDATVVAQSLTYSYFDDAPPAANDGSRIEEKGQFIWRTANARTTGFTIPAIKDEVLTLSGAVDRENALVIALDDVVTGVGAIFAGADGSDITSLYKAYQRFNRSTRRSLPADR